MLKFLLDEHTECYAKKLLELHHEVEYVKQLRKQDEKFRNDLNVALHAKATGMIIITKDGEAGQACEDNEISCIWINDERIFEEMILPRLDELKSRNSKM